MKIGISRSKLWFATAPAAPSLPSVQSLLPVHLKLSDYLQLISILAGAVASGSAFGFIVQQSLTTAGYAAGIASLSAIASQWFQSKGD